jgi:hypothetical protein
MVLSKVEYQTWAQISGTVFALTTGRLATESACFATTSGAENDSGMGKDMAKPLHQANRRAAIARCLSTRHGPETATHTSGAI